jgi:hypothetical protein
MAAKLRPLTLKDAPRPQRDAQGNPVLIRDHCPSDYDVPKAFHSSGAHNQVFLARHRSLGHEAVIFRRNTDTKHREEEIEEDVAAEIIYGIELHGLGIAPAIYAFGFCPARKNSESGYYWQVMEKYDGSLRAYIRRNQAKGKARLCGHELAEVEHQLIVKFGRMADHRMFCMDIHALNVVVRGGRHGPHKTLRETRRKTSRNSRNGPIDTDKLELELIDFDNTFCVTSTRIRFHANERTRISASDRLFGADPDLPIYVIGRNNLLIALLLCFSSNTHEVCGRKPLFRDVLREMLAGRSRWLTKAGGDPDLNEVLRFLTASKAQGRDTTLRVMQHWTHWVDHEKATARRLAEIVLGRYVPKRMVPVPWPLPRSASSPNHRRR